MPVDVISAEKFLHANARLLDRHRAATLFQGAPVAPALAALCAYRNPDGGFGHALEPDVRGPESEPASALHALDVLAELDELGDPMVAGAAAWISTIVGQDGGVPFVMPAAARYPHAPWMLPTTGGSQLTFALAAVLTRARSNETWLRLATTWCWAQLARPDGLQGYLVKFALAFLDEVDDESRAQAAIETLRSKIREDGTLPVAGGVEDEQLTPLTLSPRRASRSRVLFTTTQIDADLDVLEHGQQADGGWTFDWLAWSAGQSVEWRGLVTTRALATLADHGRVELPLRAGL
ncbi:MAG: hypothetical protein ABI317_14735 [Gaiellales bacterium]